MNPHFTPIDYEFTMLDGEGQKAKLDQHAKELSTARVEMFNAKQAMMRENERLINLQKRGIRHKNKMHLFHERVEHSRALLLELEESPLTHVLQGMQNESVS